MTRHYFDHNATTPLAPEVARMLGETLQHEYGNASSIHREGQKARELLGLSAGESARIKPTSLEKYIVFVQSTSYTRKLIGGTRFLYEVEDWDRVAEKDEVLAAK